MAPKGGGHYNFDPVILTAVILLVGIGLVAVYSASSILAEQRYGDHYYYLRKQLMFCLFGFLVMIIAKNINYLLYRRFVYLFLVSSTILLALLLVPRLGIKVGGAQRWFRLGFISIQPSEIAKLSLAMFVAYSMQKNFEHMGSFSRGLLPHLLAGTIVIGLILAQPDLGTAVIIGMWILILLFIGGVNLAQLIVLLGLAVPILFYLITQTAYRLNRLWAFLNPWEDPQGIGFQIIHSFLAFGSGGFLGVGLGNSKQKLLYLPEPHTDFILAIIAEEIGFIGVSALLILFTIVVIRGIKIALRAPELYGTYLAMGISCMLAIQVIVNMGVVMALLPTKGLTLPFISYGGSSLIVNFMSIGILMNISRKAVEGRRR
ncbi:MAG: putative lipid II flippase FtsW [Deltaproteobacteria bacterium]|nr:putative lipid II flippase FtsW [Deltaproteobacteria bacterium]MBW2076155.1 putative lipid II flippase FtsW [Deltaproteobacteria bacterium]MBW2310750.1 putative lipid II flippase FtsW [Deltaproteobacteria bacterium]RLB28533.1 MAG: putative lipid II flippase FtsW [Deltaproteobacteria bacterium]